MTHNYFISENRTREKRANYLHHELGHSCSIETGLKACYLLLTAFIHVFGVARTSAVGSAHAWAHLSLLLALKATVVVFRKLDEETLLRPGEDVPVHELERILCVRNDGHAYIHTIEGYRVGGTWGLRVVRGKRMCSLFCVGAGRGNQGSGVVGGITSVRRSFRVG